MTQTKQLPLADLSTFPGNPRRGDLAAIKASLEQSGQYRALVVRAGSLEVLAGNHTLMAMRELGWEKALCHLIDCDDEQARRIVLADNRTAELAGYDEQALADLLAECDDLAGTGWDQGAVDELLATLEDGGGEGEGEAERDEPQFDPAQGLKAPFVWFGGKRRVAGTVWQALGDVENYVEPFAGSLAVLLCRPEAHEHRTETVNDADSYLANFWRAVALDPAGAAQHADWPVNETDLIARHLWLVNEGRARIHSMEQDPEFFDAKVAGWWVWGINAWIGSGWCSGTGPWKLDTPDTPDDDRKLPHLASAGRGVKRQRPHLGDAGRGVNRQRPHLGDAGQGVNRKLPHLGDAGRGIAEYFEQLAARLRGVRVCCGDWARVVTNGALSYGSTVGVFLDPPYLGDVRTADLYSVDDHTISNAVREWALEHGSDPRYRIVLAGYGPEHERHMPKSWRILRYSASAAYQTKAQTGGDQGNQANRHQECLWFSPHCLAPTP